MGRVGVAATGAERRGSGAVGASLTPSCGVDRGGSERLWATQLAASGLVATGEAALLSGLDAEVAYGIALFGDRFTGTPGQARPILAG